MSMHLPENYRPAQWCTYCGATGQPLQPCAAPGHTVPTVWLCVRCVGLLAGLEGLAVPYVHPRFAPGTWVYVHPAIQMLHSQHYCAGQVVQVCEGCYYPSLEAFGERPHQTMVPVLCPAAPGGSCFVEEEYVSPVEKGGC